MRFGVPVVWREHKNHEDCYFCIGPDGISERRKIEIYFDTSNCSLIMNNWTMCAISVAPRFNKGGEHWWGVRAEAPAANGFLRFSRKKHSFQHTFLSKKDIPVPAVSTCSHYYSARQYKNILVVHV